MSFKDSKDQGNSRIKGFLRRKDGPKLEDLDKNATANTDHKEFIVEKLTAIPREDPTQTYESPSLSWAERIENGKRRMALFRRKMVKQNFPVFAFLSFSCWVLYKMESQLDGMRRKVFVQKSIKQQEIEKENELIEKALKSNPFEENVQIQEAEPAYKYRFEDDDDEEDEGDINTKGDLFFALTKEEEDTGNIPEETEQEVQRRIDPNYPKYLKKKASEKNNIEDDYYHEKI